MNKTTAWIAALLLLPASAQLLANDTDDAVIFAEKLNEFTMYDWSVEMLKKEIAKNPSDVDLLRVALATTYFKARKEAEGNAEIAKIATSSRYYPDAQCALGLVQFGNGRVDESIRFFEQYRSFYKKAFAEKLPTLDELERYQRDIAPLAGIYAQTRPDPIKFADVMSDIAEIKVKLRDKAIRDAGIMANVDDLNLANPESELYTINVNLVDFLDADRKAGKPLNQALFKRAIDGLKKLYWGSPDVRDLAAMQVGRAYTVSGNFAEAQKTFDSFKTNIDVWETPGEDGSTPYMDNPGASPKAAYRHYLGELCKARADKETDPAKKKKELAKALNYFYACLKYNAGYLKSEAVLTSLLSVNEDLEKMTGKLPLALTDPVLTKVLASGAVSDKARTLMADKKYEAAIPELLKGYARAPLDESAKEAVFMLAEAFRETNAMLDACVVSDLAVQRWPTDENVGNLILNIGSNEWSTASKMPKTDPMRAMRVSDAVRLLDKFLDLFPTHTSGPDIAYTLARAELESATDMLKEVDKITDPVKRLAQIDEGYAGYVAAAKKFQRVVDRFAQNKQRVSQSLYLIGNCYSIAEKFPEAEKALREFCAKEKDDLEKLASAKFMICDNAYREASSLDKSARMLSEKAGKLGEEDAAKLNAEADSQLKRSRELFLKAALEYEDFVGNFFKNTLKETTEAKVKTRLASAMELIGWSYDGAAEKDKAIAAFLAYLNSPYNDKKTAKRAPAVLSRLAILYTEKNNPRKAAEYLEQLVKKYPRSNESRDARFILGRSMYQIKDYAKAAEAFQKMFAETQNKNIPAWTWVLNNMIVYPNSEKPVMPEMAKVAVTAGEKLLKEMDAQIQNPKNPDPSGWFSDAAIKGFNKDPKAIWENLYTTQERLWLNYGKACYAAGLFKEAAEIFEKLIEPPRNRGLKAKETKYISPYFYDALLLRGDALLKAGNEEEAHRSVTELIKQAAFQNRYDLQRKGMCKDADLYIEVKKYKNALDVLESIASLQNLKEEPEVVYPPNATPSVRAKIKQDADDRFQEELKYIEYGLARYAFCAAKLGLKDKADEIVKRYREAFGKGRYGRELDNLPAAEAANQP